MHSRPFHTIKLARRQHKDQEKFLRCRVAFQTAGMADDDPEVGDFGVYDDVDYNDDGAAAWDGADVEYNVDAVDTALSAGGGVSMQREESGSSTGAPPSAAFILGTAVGAIQSDFGVELELSGFVDLAALGDVARIGIVENVDLGLTPPASVAIQMQLAREDAGEEPSFRPAATMRSGETGAMSGVLQARTSVRIAELACKVADATSRAAAAEALSQEFMGFRTEGSHLKVRSGAHGCRLRDFKLVLPFLSLFVCSIFACRARPRQLWRTIGSTRTPCWSCFQLASGVQGLGQGCPPAACC